jgi:hypothetical protein
MKKFLAIYTGNADGRARWNQLSETERKSRESSGMQAWAAWMDKNKGAIVETGSPLGKTKRVERGGVEDIRNTMAAYSVVQADSHEAAAKLFEGHPHFTIFPGDGVEIMEILPVPTM